MRIMRTRRRAIRALDEHEAVEGIGSYLIGLGLATLLTVVSFFIARTTLVWQPSIPVALAVLAIAQMGVHLVFFLHITTRPRQRQQRHGACLRRADRLPGHRRFALDHGAPEPQHDADGPDHADAALSGTGLGKCGVAARLFRHIHSGHRFLVPLLPLVKPLQHGEEGGDEQYRKTGRCDHAAEHADPE